MDFSWCQPPCSCLIASDDQHGKCLRCVGQAHAGDAIFGISNCNYCKNFTLKTLCARLAVFDRESSVLPRSTAAEASSLCKAAAWSSDAELEAMESEQFSLSLPPLRILQFSFLVAVYTKLMEVLACATEKLSLDWPDQPRESPSSKLDERFL